MSHENFFCDRLVIRGMLRIPYAFHIGSGETSRRSDAPIRRDANGRPYIPGSSLAGVLRSAARDFAPYFLPDSKTGLKQLFGKGGQESEASRVIVEDAFLLGSLPAEVEVREHVGIDRRKGAARPHLQYDREVTPSNTCYRFEVSIERPTENEVGLLLAVLDVWSEFGLHLGGRTTTGLGEAQLDGNSLVFHRLDFNRPDILRAYLCCGDPQDPSEYLPPESQVSRGSLPSPTPMYPSPATKPDAEAFCPQHLFLTVDLIPEEPLLIQAPIPRIPDPAAPLFGPGRSSDADFVTALVAPAGTNGKLAERQYIPGSSLKGVLRTRAEKIVRTLSFCRRGVDTTTDEGYRTAQTSYAERICACAVTHSEQDGDFPEPERLLACFGTVEKQRAAQRKAREIAASQQKDTTFARALYDKSCVTCRLFGNTMMQGRLHVGDTTLVAEPQPKLFDHVAIDRFHGGAEDKQKFDTRPLMPTATVDANHNPPPTFQPMFSLRLHLERFEPWMLGLLGYLLKDLRTADLRLGHATHRGYGRIRGKITSGELLVLPNSALESLCVAHEVLPPEQEQRQRFGPYWRVRLDLRQLFGGDAWPQEGLQGEALNTPTAKLLLACAQKLREELIPREEGKVHGSF